MTGWVADERRPLKLCCTTYVRAQDLRAQDQLLQSPAGCRSPWSCGSELLTMTTIWAILEDACYYVLLLNGWVRLDDYVDGRGLVAMVRTAQP
jgi:hypothetical protein